MKKFCSKIFIVKIFLKTLFIFLCFILLQGARNVSCDTSSHTDYIQNDYQKIALITQNTRSAEVVAQEANANQQLSYEKYFGAYSNQNAGNLYLDKTPEISGKNIHNLSNLLKSEILIRAP